MKAVLVHRLDHCQPSPENPLLALVEAADTGNPQNRLPMPIVTALKNSFGRWLSWLIYCGIVYIAIYCNASQWYFIVQILSHLKCCNRTIVQNEKNPGYVFSLD